MKKQFNRLAKSCYLRKSYFNKFCFVSLKMEYNVKQNSPPTTFINKNSNYHNNIEGKCDVKH